MGKYNRFSLSFLFFETIFDDRCKKKKILSDAVPNVYNGITKASLLQTRVKECRGGMVSMLHLNW